ncbi:MAG: TFIIB-type zinc ribbon-containing protein, partial [Clostridia bacterium]|nr:TFIIB-type zinc ribbon-containing protein [Clostridia bacterium]
NLYLCPSCGAEVAADENTAAQFCCYCHSPVILEGKLSGQMKPDKLVAFKIDRENAKGIFSKWAKKKIFAPKQFSDPAQIERMQGVYFPFWVTDADADARLSAHATRVRSFRKGNYMITETSHFRVHRSGDIHFEDITSAAIKEENKKMLEGILPYPSEELVPFSTPYLSGFYAKKRDIERAELTDEVRGRMQEYSRIMLRDTISGYSTVSVTDSEMHIRQSHWEYALMPLWMLVYCGKKRKYTYALNGSTGKVYGEVPISLPKILLFALGILALGAGLCALIGGVL